MTAIVTVLVVITLLLTVLVVSLLRSHAEILRALHDLGVDLDPNRSDRRTATSGTTRPRSAAGAAAAAGPPFDTAPGVPQPGASLGLEAADIVGTSPDGDAIKVGVIGSSAPTLLAFLTTGCTTCAGFWEDFARGVRLPTEGMRLIVVTQGEGMESPAAVAERATPELTVVMSSEAWDAYDIPVAPYFVLVDGEAGRVVGEGAAASWEQVTALLARAMADTGYDPEAPRSRRALLTGREREARADDELLRAGVEPGDPSLYEDPAAPDAVPGDRR